MKATRGAVLFLCLLASLMMVMMIEAREPIKMRVHRKPVFKNFVHQRNADLHARGIITEDYNTPLEGSENSLGVCYPPPFPSSPPFFFTSFIYQFII